MSSIKFIDTHFHLFDFKNKDMKYEHFEPEFIHPLLGTKLQKLSESSYLIENYLDDIKTSNVPKAVHVQAAMGSKDPVLETKWVTTIAEKTTYPNAIVGHADLKNPKVENVLVRHCEYSRLKGIRDFSYGDYLVEENFHKGFSLLGKYNLVASLDVPWNNMHKLRDLAIKFPNIPIIIDHAGVPTERTAEYFNNWKIGIQKAAEAPNIFCKISGLGMADYQWTTDSIKPWVLHCIESFTPKRSLFATNWPVDKLFSNYETIVNAYDKITLPFSKSERELMFSKNAETLYNI